MSEYIHLCLTDLLDSDLSSNEFFYSLSPQTQKSLLKKDIRTFEELQQCADSYKKHSPDIRGEILDNYNPACSANDCTGLISSGANQSSDEIESYNQITPFSKP